MSEKWGGYASSSKAADLIHNPVCATIIGAVWFSCAIMLSLGFLSVWAALINLVICRYYFIHMRWKSVLRGMGAPGFMIYWLAAAVFLLELTLHYVPSLRALALLVLQVDLAFIMLSAGIYKFTAGYAHNQGMEYGLVNPQWGYWWRHYKKTQPQHLVLRTLNHLAWSTEIAAAILMLIPQTRFIGALLILFSFIYISTQIRLAFLCEMVILSCFLFFHPGSLSDQLIVQLLRPITSGADVTAAPLTLLNLTLGSFLWAYLILIPISHAGLFYNFYRRKALPGVLQPVLEKYTNFFGLIIWRVFSVDLVNFFILIYKRLRDGSERTLVSRYGLKGGVRYGHVAESITVTGLFTTLKYYANNAAIFKERLLRYSKTVPCPSDSVLEFDYMSISKSDKGFDFKVVARYTVDTAYGTVAEQIIEKAVNVHEAHSLSPVHQGVRPGSYAPLNG